MKLVDSIAPFIDIIIQIVIDIKYFMMVFIMAMLALSISFYLLAQNQLDFDIKNDLTREEKEKLYPIPYSSFGSSIWYMWQLCLGGASTATYAVGEGSQEIYLIGFYIMAQFLMIIHLLNMLIAIMGETFVNCKEIGHLVKIQDHLAFVIDNWYLSPISIPDKEKLVFIVTAFLVNEKTDDNEILKDLKHSVGNLRKEF